jgi:ElaB/YqjD/DUF883 family membrane-anchored ribosome-binding protein
MKRNHNAEATHDAGTLAEEAKALLAATAEVAEDKIVQARERLSAALERGREVWGTVQDGAVQGAKATDKTIRLHPYHAVGIAFGVGALVGGLFMRRSN